MEKRGRSDKSVGYTTYFLVFMIIIILMSFMLIGAGCRAMRVKEILEDSDKYLGKEVLVQGKVSNTFKISQISGFTLVDLSDSKYKILVSSKELPLENKTVTVKGTVMKEILLGYYIYANKIS
jgi:hypothetical protein